MNGSNKSNQLGNLTIQFLHIIFQIHIYGACQVVLVVKNPPANAGGVRDASSIPGPGRRPGEGNGNLAQCSCLENPMDRGAWWATVHGVTKSWRRLKQLSVHARIRPQTTKLLENIGRTASDIKCDNIFLVPYPKAKEIKAKITQMGPN